MIARQGLLDFKTDPFFMKPDHAPLYTPPLLAVINNVASSKVTVASIEA